MCEISISVSILMYWPISISFEAQSRIHSRSRSTLKAAPWYRKQCTRSKASQKFRARAGKENMSPSPQKCALPKNKFGYALKNCQLANLGLDLDLARLCDLDLESNIRFRSSLIHIAWLILPIAHCRPLELGRLLGIGWLLGETLDQG